MLHTKMARACRYQFFESECELEIFLRETNSTEVSENNKNEKHVVNMQSQMKSEFLL